MRKLLPDPITFAEHPSVIIGHGVGLIEQTKRFALITSIAISGGAARELGSLAVVDEGGAMTGYLSNGCIDKDIQLHALDALKTGMKKLIRYGDGSNFADLSLPCGGSLSVLIDPAPDVAALTQAHRDLRERRTAVLNFTVPPKAGKAEHSICFEYRPQFRLVLAGRGAIFRAVAQVGHAAGFEVFCMTPDVDDLVAVQSLNKTKPTHLFSPSQAVLMPQLDENAAFLTLFHDHEWEPELLRAAIATPAHFIGSLGSRRTHQARLDHLRNVGVAEVDIDRLNGPIGLVASLRDAPLIAVSAIAEITASLPQSICEISEDFATGSGQTGRRQAYSR